MKKLLTFFLSAIIFFSCDDFGDINTNPNNPSQPDTRFLFIQVVRQALPNFHFKSILDPWPAVYAQYIAEKTNIQYTDFSFSTFQTEDFYIYSIKNLSKIIELNTDATTKAEVYVTTFGDNDNQIAVARSLKAYIYMHLTDALGMIPYFETGLANEGNFKPKLDEQQAIYTDLNKELEEAFLQFNEAALLNSEYDIVYGGDISKWKKFNASVRMQLAIKLFKRDEAAGKTRFAKAYNDGFIRNASEIFQYNYLNEAANENPLYENMLVGMRRDYQPSGTIISTLLAYNDPRVKVYAEKNKFGTYYGIPFGLTASAAAQINTDTVSAFHPKYYQQNSPAILITPSVMLFAAAEAAERGWITDSAEDLYNEAIAAAFTQHEISDELAAYLTQPQVRYKTTGSKDERIAQIAVQKWIASYLQDSFEAWSDWRRLDAPDLKPGPNAVITAIPRRKTYHTEDYNANLKNYNAAIELQGADDVFTRVWWNE